MLEIVAPLDGDIVNADALGDGPIKLLQIPLNCAHPAVALREALPRMVHRGMIYGDADTYDVAVGVLPPKVRTNHQRWVWSQPWAPEDADRLQAAHPELVIGDEVGAEIARKLWPAYADYTKTVSPYDMAMSFETAIFLYHLCRETGPVSVADYGSGFSSYVLRFWAREAGIHDVVSVDDDRSWLNRSIEFCRRHKLNSVGQWARWQDVHDKLPSTEIVFHDLAGGDMRDVTMGVVMASATRFAVVDDCQVDHHRDAFYRFAAEFGFDTFALLQTNDHIQRFSMLGVKS